MPVRRHDRRSADVGVFHSPYGLRHRHLHQRRGPTFVSKVGQVSLTLPPGKPFNPHPQGQARFVIEFQGEPLMRLRDGALPEPTIWTSRGSISLIQVEPAPDHVPGHWRLFFDLAVDGKEPVEIRAFLHEGAQMLTETWLFLFEPPPTA